MASFSTRQSPLQPSSNRAAITHLGRAQQPEPPLLSGRAAAGHLGVGRRYATSSSLLTPRQLPLPGPPLPDFARLRADAERIKLRIDAQSDSLARIPTPAPAPAPPRGMTPKEAGYPIPFLTPAEQARRAREKKQLQEKALAEYNQAASGAYLPEFLRKALSKPKVNLQTPAAPAGPDSFMPTTFWKSQNPTGAKGKWADCANTVYSMLAAVNGADKKPWNRYDLVVEHQTAARLHNFPVRDYYVAVQGARAAKGMALLDEYMAAKKPVMVGVSHTINFYLTRKDKNGNTVSSAINGGTIDHFVAIVGSGVDKKGKYYRFFDVGTVDRKRGTHESNRLYYDAATGFYKGHSQATGKDYVLAQVRF